MLLKKTETEELQQESTLDQLKGENARLESEIGLLKAKNEKLRKAGQ
jgi:cell division protein FtsB